VARREEGVRRELLVEAAGLGSVDLTEGSARLPNSQLIAVW